MRFFVKHVLEHPSSYIGGRPVALDELDASRDYDTVSADILLFQSGYLSIQSVRDNGEALLCYPNKEVALSLMRLQAPLAGGGMVPIVEKHNAYGRSDMELSVGGRHWVFEFNFARDEDTPDRLLAQAEEQMRTRRYGLAEAGAELVRGAMVYGAAERRIVRRKALESPQQDAGCGDPAGPHDARPEAV